jgi:hypothetical protein
MARRLGGSGLDASRRWAWRAGLLLALLLLAMATPARADRLDDDLNSVWESVWDERGTPIPLLRWNGPLQWRLVGSEAGWLRQHVRGAIDDLRAHTGLAFEEVTQAPSSSTHPYLEIQVVEPASRVIAESQGCAARPHSVGGVLRQARVWVREHLAYTCVHHELMHAMGILGHPSGRTVLSYFPWRRDTFMDLDALMLRIWYDPALRPGASPLEILVVASRHVARQPSLGLAPEVAEERRARFVAERLRDMERFALGDGEVPTIVKRSGRASWNHMEAARPQMALYLGRAAARGLTSPPDPLLAHTWFTRAARADVAGARAELDRLEATMDPALRQRARAAVPP